MCGEDLKIFLERTGRNAVCTSYVSVVEFMDALRTWVEEFLLKLLCQASCFSIMADECTDVSTIEDMFIYCRVAEEHLFAGNCRSLEVLPLFFKESRVP